MKFLILLALASCSHINQQSQDYYASKQDTKKMRHGVILLENPVVKKFDQASMLRGKDLYEKNCLSCHGIEGIGDGPEAAKQEHAPANLKKLVKTTPNFKFFMSISQWQGDMPGWKEPFSEIDREDLTAYIKTFR